MMQVDECGFEVESILRMWVAIEAACNRHASLEAEYAGWTHFPGFHPVEEVEQLKWARFLIEDLDRFPEFANRNLESRYARLPTYRRMVARLGKLDGNQARSLLAVARQVGPEELAAMFDKMLLVGS